MPNKAGREATRTRKPKADQQLTQGKALATSVATRARKRKAADRQDAAGLRLVTPATAAGTAAVADAIATVTGDAAAAAAADQAQLQQQARDMRLGGATRIEIQQQLGLTGKQLTDLIGNLAQGKPKRTVDQATPLDSGERYTCPACGEAKGKSSYPSAQQRTATFTECRACRKLRRTKAGK